MYTLFTCMCASILFLFTVKSKKPKLFNLGQVRKNYSAGTLEPTEAN